MGFVPYQACNLGHALIFAWQFIISKYYAAKHIFRRAHNGQIHNKIKFEVHSLLYLLGILLSAIQNSGLVTSAKEMYDDPSKLVSCKYL